MDDIWTRVVENMMARVSGPMKFRLVLQPTDGGNFHIPRTRGCEDRQAAVPLGDHHRPAHRRAARGRLEERRQDFLLAMVLDVVYQVIVARSVYPGEVIIVAVALAILLDPLLRGLVTRIARSKMSGLNSNNPEGEVA